MELVKQLKDDHTKIIHGFEFVRKGITEEKFEDGDMINQLKDLKDILVVHLSLEDEKLYPGLIDAGGEAKELGEKFSNEMFEISNRIIIFLEKYMDVAFLDESKGKVILNLLKSSEFRKELDNVMKIVSKRIDAEENILFSAFEKYCNND